MTRISPLANLPVRILRTIDTGKYPSVCFIVDGDYDGEYFAEYHWRVIPGGYVQQVTIPQFESSEKTGEKISTEKKTVYLHQLILPKKKGYWIAHKNGNKLDNRSANLVYMTPSEIARIREKNHPNSATNRPPRTHCIHGHEYTPENTYIYMLNDGRTIRSCRKCREISHSKIVKSSSDGYSPFSRKKGTDSVRYSKYRGVRKCTTKNRFGSGRRVIPNRWEAMFRGKYMGTYKNEEEAARVYDKLAYEQYGDKAILNFPKEEDGERENRTTAI